MDASIPWWMYALLGAVFASLISIFGKFGMKDINSDLATAVRSVVQAAFVVGFASIIGVMSHLRDIHARAWIMVALSGVAGGLSWICMFRALQKAPVAKVGPIDKLSMPISIVLAVILLSERPSSVNWVGIVVIVAGVYLATTKWTPTF